MAFAIDKRYFAGYKLKTLCLDPRTNPRLAERREESAEDARATAEFLGSLPDRCIAALMAALEDPSARTIRACVDITCAELRNCGRGVLARDLEGAGLRANTIAQGIAINLDNFDVFRGARPALRVGMMVDFDAFHWCIDHLNGLLKLLGVHKAHVIADEPQGAWAFQRLFIARSMARSWPHIGWLDFASKPIPGIEAADLLAGFTRRLVLGDVPSDLRVAADELLFSYFSSPPRFRYFGRRAMYETFQVRVANFFGGTRAHLINTIRAPVAAIPALLRHSLDQ